MVRHLRGKGQIEASPHPFELQLAALDRRLKALCSESLHGVLLSAIEM